MWCAGVVAVKRFRRSIVEGPQSELFGLVVCAVVSSAALAVVIADLRPSSAQKSKFNKKSNARNRKKRKRRHRKKLSSVATAAAAAAAKYQLFECD